MLKEQNIYFKKKYEMIKTVGEIIKKFRTEGACIKFSPRTIGYMASKLGYKKKRAGGKIGYDQSLITAISRHIREAVAYEEGLKNKTSQKPKKQSIETNYFAQNGERDNVDYEWEKQTYENKINRAIIESINEVLGTNILL